jgi:mRNA interferase MazF
MLGMTYNQKEIVLVPFPYSDLTAIKKRPVLVISNNHFNSEKQDVLVCAITSKQFLDKYSVELTNDSLQYGVLPEPSVIKPYKLFTISKDKILKKFSIINDQTFNDVIAKFHNILQRI